MFNWMVMQHFACVQCHIPATIRHIPSLVAYFQHTFAPQMPSGRLSPTFMVIAKRFIKENILVTEIKCECLFSALFEFGAPWFESEKKLMNVSQVSSSLGHPWQKISFLFHLVPVRGLRTHYIHASQKCDLWQNFHSSPHQSFDSNTWRV